MTDPDLIPGPPSADDQPFTPSPARSDVAASPPDAGQSRSPLWVAGAIGFLVLAIGEIWLFNLTSHTTDQTAHITTLDHQVDGLDHQVDGLNHQVDRLNTRVASLTQQFTALAARPIPKPAPAPIPPPAIPASLDRKLAALQATITSLASTTQADHDAVTSMQGQAATLPKLVAKAQTLATIAQASLALENGTPLGTIPDAPAALQRYSTTAPPTLAALQATFPDYADKADTAGGTIETKGGFWRTVKGRVESLITIRHNAETIVGSRAAGTLGAARTALDQGNLPKTLAILNNLPTPSQTAMAPWTTQATHLLAARAALVKLTATP